MRKKEVRRRSRRSRSFSENLLIGHTSTVFSYISTLLGCSLDLGCGIAREQHLKEKFTGKFVQISPPGVEHDGVLMAFLQHLIEVAVDGRLLDILGHACHKGIPVLEVGVEVCLVEVVISSHFCI